MIILDTPCYSQERMTPCNVSVPESVSVSVHFKVYLPACQEKFHLLSDQVNLYCI